MKNYIFLLFLSITAINGSAQTDGKWELGINFAPSYYFGKDQIVFSDVTGYDITADNLNYSIGLQARYRIADKWKLVAGIDYATKDITGIYFCHVCDLSPQDPARINIRFAELPLLARYHFTTGKIALFAEFGVLGSAIVSRFPSDVPVEPWSSFYLGGESISPFFLSGKAGFGIDMEIAPKLALSFTGFYSHSIINTKLNRFYSVGLNTALIHKF